ncbi:Mce protein [Mycobacterium sp.]|uniref:Mce protein n=1 Tax=Mycobacterium sp. TaxID=1785 RepID=UPI003F96F281
MAEHADAERHEVSEANNLQTSPAATELLDVQADDAEDYDAATDDDVDDASRDAASGRKPISPVRLATACGLVMVVGLAALGGWFEFRAHQAIRAEQQRQLLLQVGRQGALNLTTIDWQHADADVQRVLDSATGAFHDDFSTRSKPFVELVKKVQSKSVGTVTEAGLESQSGDEAQVLVAISVDTTSLAAPEQDVRHWRMRIAVQKTGTDAKISDVVFVS